MNWKKLLLSRNPIIYFSLFILTVNLNPGYAQALEICTKVEYGKNHPITFSIINKDSVDYFLYVDLEKYTDQWAIYSEDVFSKPPQTNYLSLILNKGKSSSFKFKLEEPNWLDDPNLTQKENREIRKKLRMGKFRLKVYYNEFEGQFTNYLYSDEFIIK